MTNWGVKREIVTKWGRRNRDKLGRKKEIVTKWGGRNRDKLGRNDAGNRDKYIDMSRFQ